VFSSDDHSRRDFLRRSVALAPVAALTTSFVPASAQEQLSKGDPKQGTPAENRPASGDYKPAFFTPNEWVFVIAACDRLIPSDNVGPGAVELGVPEFLDRHMQTPYASGDIWYMQGPFVEAAPEFGYQGRLPLRDILRVGIAAVDAHCKQTFGGKTFAQLDHAQQEALLKSAESGALKLESISSKLFFSQFLGEVRNGYFSDPAYGGNKGMGSWKMIGYPGMRADYADWVTVRDKPYPLPPVDLAGERA
jgi:gluconate 2-dehydrogenase gamma chain